MIAGCCNVLFYLVMMMLIVLVLLILLYGGRKDARLYIEPVLCVLSAAGWPCETRAEKRAECGRWSAVKYSPRGA